MGESDTGSPASEPGESAIGAAPRAFTHAVLGRTGRELLRLGVAAGFGVGGRDLEAAVEEHGVGYLYWGSLRRASFGKAIQSLAQRGLRDQMFVVVQSYSRIGALVRPSLCMALKRLGIERADLLLLGWWNKAPSRRILDAALAAKEAGLVAHVGVSTHERPLVPGFAGESPFDVVHFRYNAANRGAEDDIFPRLPADRAARAGLCAFTATRWRQLLAVPRGAPEGAAPLSAGDCYRFVLARPEVDICMSGPRDGADLRAALAALHRGAPDPDELERMRCFGDVVYGRPSLNARFHESVI